MTTISPIYVGNDALANLLRYCADQKLTRFTLVSDTNTHRALGAHVTDALRANGYDVTTIVLSSDEVIADERHLMTVLVNAPLEQNTFLAVGSGTLTDITRFISHRTGRSFISLPTAPSVDGFTSIGAPLVLNLVKHTIISQAPIALFADLTTLQEAPQRLSAAGYGDMIGKITSLADWHLGSVVWDEPFDEAIFRRSESAIEGCISHTETIGQRSQEGMRYLIEALIDSGLCMLDFGDSRPASGAEHHASHYWEMLLLQEGRPAALHGAKVGFALTLIAGQYAKIRALSREEMRQRLAAASLPARDVEVAAIRQGYGVVAEDVARAHSAFLNMTQEQFDAIKQRIDDRWDTIQRIASKVPSPEQIVSYLERVGAPTNGAALGLTDGEVVRGLQYGHYLRSRFTVMKLSRILDIPLS
jgi:glycerol-1-phosphate dehydrogenase [NAD(P)+]